MTRTYFQKTAIATVIATGVRSFRKSSIFWGSFVAFLLSVENQLDAPVDGRMRRTVRKFAMVLFASVFLFRTSFKFPLPDVLWKPMRIIFGLVLLPIVYGVAQAYFGLPPVFQILPLGFASLLVCTEISPNFDSARPCES